MSADPPTGLEAGMNVGDFRIEERLGAGGMGVVYRARQVGLDRVVALKVLGAALRTEAGIARFRREAQAIAKLKHPGIAAIYFIGQDAQICYIAMEYVNGVSLREVLSRLRTAPGAAAGGRPQPEDVVWATQPQEQASRVMRFDIAAEEPAAPPCPEAAGEWLSPAACALVARRSFVSWCVQIVRDAALALAHAHQQGVIHRDVKPENLLLEPAGKVTVIDFGLARFYEDETVTYTGQLVGTPLYMSPEQIIGRHQLDARTDVYSLGMVLHELLTLAPPVTAPNRQSLLFQIATRALPPIDWKNPAVPPALAAIVHHALAKDPDDRYSTMAEFAADLDRFLAGKEVAAPPYRYRFDETEIVARRPTTVLYLAFFCFAIALFGGVMSVIAGFLAFFAASSAQNPLGILAGVGVVIGPTVLLAVLGRGLVLGRRWAWWLGLGVGAPLCALAVASPLVGGFACILGLAGFCFLAVLSQPRVRSWFRFAAESRRGFRQQAQRAV
jgi:serine/threonine protein kinase